MPRMFLVKIARDHHFPCCKKRKLKPRSFPSASILVTEFSSHVCLSFVTPTSLPCLTCWYMPGVLKCSLVLPVQPPGCLASKAFRCLRCKCGRKDISRGWVVPHLAHPALQFHFFKMLLHQHPALTLPKHSSHKHAPYVTLLYFYQVVLSA